MRNYYFTSESVTEGHPDKICDLISDSVLDAIFANDPYARVACETMIKGKYVTVAGEITAAVMPDIEQIVRNTIREIGYTDNSCEFSADNAVITQQIVKQSSDIAMGVDKSLEVKSGIDDDSTELGAGDQGMMFGYACRETDELMPLAISLAHRLCRRLTEARKSGELDYLRPDGKSQVTVEYIDGKANRIDAVVVSTQHSADVDIDRLRADIKEKVIKRILPADMIDENTKYFINPTGRFVIGGPEGDSGLTGRKIIVDTYGGAAAHGGGAFSGKDPTKVDRSGAYMARYIAKNVVSAGLADRCELELAYAIGVANPVSVSIKSDADDEQCEKIEAAIKRVFDMRPSAIIEHLGLRAPIYRQTAAYGHFGRDDLNVAWERTDMVDKLKKAYAEL